MTGFSITTDENGNTAFSYDEDTTLASKIWLRLNIQKKSFKHIGDWFFNPDAFSELHLVMNNVNDDVDELVKDYAIAALQPLIDKGLAKEININTEFDTNENRVKLTIEAIETDEKTTKIEHFVKVT